MSTIAVLNAAGAQGRSITEAVTRHDGVDLRAISRSTGVGLDEVGALSGALAGCEAVIVTIPLVFDEAVVVQWGANLAAALSDAGVQRIVYNAGTRLPENRDKRAGFRARDIVTAALEAVGVPLVVVQPPVFFENFLAPGLADVIRSGVLPYPLPAETKAAWMSLRDLGEIVASLAVGSVAATGTLRVGGPTDLTGPQLADAAATALGSGVKYVAMAPSDFTDQLRAPLGDVTAEALGGLYEWVAGSPSTDLLTGGRSVDATENPVSAESFFATLFE